MGLLKGLFTALIAGTAAGLFIGLQMRFAEVVFPIILVAWFGLVIWGSLTSKTPYSN